MQIAITNHIKIMVETSYQDDKRAAGDVKFMFAYRITIENQGEHTIQLMRRHWHIIDLIDGENEVEGEGVVGIQPILEPGEKHQYVSGCLLRSPIGKMYGTYQMERQFDGEIFDVAIPEFVLAVPYLNN